MIIGRLQSLNTSFIVSTEGCPNLESQGAKDVELKPEDIALTTDDDHATSTNLDFVEDMVVGEHRIRA